MASVIYKCTSKSYFVWDFRQRKDDLFFCNMPHFSQYTDITEHKQCHPKESRYWKKCYEYTRNLPGIARVKTLICKKAIATNFSPSLMYDIWCNEVIVFVCREGIDCRLSPRSFEPNYVGYISTVSWESITTTEMSKLTSKRYFPPERGENNVKAEWADCSSAACTNTGSTCI